MSARRRLKVVTAASCGSGGGSGPAGGMLEGGEQRVQSEPLRERAHELLAAVELDAVITKGGREAEISHPYGGQRLRIAADGDVDAEPGVAQTEIRVGEDEPEMAQLGGSPVEAEMDHGAASW